MRQNAMMTNHRNPEIPPLCRNLLMTQIRAITARAGMKRPLEMRIKAMMSPMTNRQKLPNMFLIACIVVPFLIVVGDVPEIYPSDATESILTDFWQGVVNPSTKTLNPLRMAYRTSERVSTC